jgi:hypothetical protein
MLETKVCFDDACCSPPVSALLNCDIHSFFDGCVKGAEDIESQHQRCTETRNMFGIV